MSTPIASATTPGTLYTVGYAHREGPERVEQLMQQERILLFDIRMNPQSRWHPEWNRKALTTQYCQRYSWERRLGNVHYQHPEKGIQLALGHEQAIRYAVDLLRGGTSLILLCACSNPHTCHRTVVAEMIREAMGEQQRPTPECSEDSDPIYPDIASAQPALDRGAWVRIQMEPVAIDPHLLQMAQDFQDRERLGEAIQRSQANGEGEQ